MPSVGLKLPSFSLKATVSTDINHAFVQITDQSYAGKWQVLFFWPKDFTFVCPTEIAAFGALDKEFAERGAQLLGASTDSEFVHLAWRTHHPELKDLPFPMLADIKRELCAALNILDPVEGVAQRATYIIDPDGIIRFVYITDLNVGREPKEVLRVLDALQHGGLMPCAWRPGQKPLTVG